MDRTRARRVLRVGAMTFAILTGLTALAGIGFVSWLRGEDGRTWLGDRIEAWVSGAIDGRLRIGTITRLDLDRAWVDRVVLETDRGERVVVGRNVEVHPDLLAAIKGQIALNLIRVHAPRVSLRFNDDGMLSLSEALRSSTHSEDALPADAIRIDRIVFDGGRIDLDLPHAPSIDMRRTSGVISMAVARGGAARIDVRRFSGHIQASAPLPLYMDAHLGHIRFVEDVRHRVAVMLPGRMGDERVRLNVDMRGRGDDFRADIVLTARSRTAILAEMPGILQTVLEPFAMYHFELRETDRLAPRATAER